MLAMTTLRRGASALACMMALLSCRPSEPNESVNNAAHTPATREPAVPLVEPPRDRADLLIAVVRAASAAALGTDDAAVQRDLDGDRFEFRLRFGCPRPDNEAPGADPFSVRFDRESRRLRLSVAPTVSADDPVVAALAGEEVEAVEGFWIERPWLLAAGCPTVPPPPEKAETEAEPAESAESDGDTNINPAPPILPRVAIAQFLTADDPRTDRRGKRPYEAAKTLPEGSEPSRQGYDLVLSGRLRANGNSKVISCTVTSSDRPPTCMVSALFDRVWIRHSGTGEIIAEWGRN